MTYRDELNEKTSYRLYTTVKDFMRSGGVLSPADEQLMEVAGESHYEDESDKEALMDLLERLHDDDLL